MHTDNLRKIKWVYWLLIALFFAEFMQALIKYFNPYYFNVITLGIFDAFLILLGYRLGINKVFVFVFGIITLALIVTMYFIVWN